MAKARKTYICNQCSAESNQWQGKCHACGTWDSLELMVQDVARQTPAYGYAGCQQAEVFELAEVEMRVTLRIKTGLDELDRVLGGGLVQGSVVLLGGDPGVGKSTLLLQMMCLLAKEGEAVLYVTGEESPEQVAMRAKRMQLPLKGAKMLASTDLEKILEVLSATPTKVLVIDSIQTMSSAQIGSAPGSVAQVRACAMHLTQYAKQQNVTVLMIGHMTKDGQVAGPRVLEHMVDTVLYIEGEKTGRYRMLRGSKNRFGAVHELGVFAMLENGMRPVKNPSLLFLSHSNKEVPGSVIMPVWEGSRAFLVELQALADESHGQEPRRCVVGLDAQRMGMLLAILHKHAGIVSSNKDVYLNVVGGLKVSEPASDLAVGLAVYSSLANIALPKQLMVMGELGLNGEVRPVQQGQARLQSAIKHGITHVIVPMSNKLQSNEVKIFAVSTIQEAKSAVLALAQESSSIKPQTCKHTPTEKKEGMPSTSTA